MPAATNRVRRRATAKTPSPSAERALRSREQLLIRRCYPCGDLGARAETELIENAADVAVDRALGYEQAGSDLLVGQAIGDQPRDFGFSFPEWPRAGVVRCCGGGDANWRLLDANSCFGARNAASACASSTRLSRSTSHSRGPRSFFRPAAPKPFGQPSIGRAYCSGGSPPLPDQLATVPGDRRSPTRQPSGQPCRDRLA